MAVQIQLRNGTAAQWTAANPTLAAGEVGTETDTSKLKIGNGSTAWNSLAYSSGTGTVSSVSVVSANGLAGTVATATTTPAITLSTSVTGVLKGNGSAISAAAAGTDYLAPPSGTAILKGGSGGALANAVAGTDYQAPITLTTTGTSGAATFASNVLNIPQYSGGGGSPGGSTTQVQYNNAGAFAGSANMTFDGTTLTAAGFSGPINGTVGATTASTGAFTTLSASSTVSGTGFSTYLASPPAIGGTAAAAGTFTAGTFTSTVHKGATSGTVTLTAPAVAGTQSYTLPTAVPASNGYVLSSTTAGVMSWAAAGSGSPGGSNTQIQFNNSSAFGGSANLVWDGTYVGVGTSSPSTYSDSTPGITTYNSTAGGRSGIVMGSNSTATDDLMGYVSFFNSNSSNTNYRMASIRANRGADANSSYLTLFTANSGAPAESLRLNGVGTVILKGGSTSATGVGITFPATQVASSDVNTLDDYEEGTWTPTDGSGAGLTFATAAGYYTKIGRVVQFSIQVVYPTTADTNNAKIGSFPFAFANANAARGNSVPSYSTYSVAIGLLNDTGGATAARFYTANGGANVTNVNLSGATIYLSGTYST